MHSRPATATFVLAQRHPPLSRLVARAQPAMDAFAKAAEQSCHLGVYDRGNITIVAQVNSPTSWGLSIRLGSREPDRHRLRSRDAGLPERAAAHRNAG